MFFSFPDPASTVSLLETPGLSNQADQESAADIGSDCLFLSILDVIREPNLHPCLPTRNTYLLVVTNQKNARISDLISNDKNKEIDHKTEL